MHRNDQVAGGNLGPDRQADADGILSLKHGEGQFDILLLEVDGRWIDEFGHSHSGRGIQLQAGRNEQRVARRIRLHVIGIRQLYQQCRTHRAGGMHRVAFGHGA